MTAGPYKAITTGKDTDPPAYSVEGPGTGIGYPAWYLFPDNMLPSMEAAELAARLMNLAFREGELRRAGQIKELIG